MHILKKQHFDAKSAQNLHILKKQRHQKSQTLCGTDWHRWIVVFKILVEYMQVWWLFTIKTFDFFLSICRFEGLEETLCQSVPHRVWDFLFFWVYAGLVTFHYQNVWFFWVYAGLRDLRRLYASQYRIESEIFCFFEYMRVLPLLASKWWSFLSICRFGEPQVSQTYSTCLQPRNKNAE